MERNEPMKENRDLTDSQDEKVQAGVGNPFGVRTRMHCDKCNFELDWAGCYLDGTVYDCPHCHAHAFHGTIFC